MIDSIKELEDQLTLPGTIQEKVDRMNALGWELAYLDPDQAISLSQEALELASQEAEPYSAGIAKSLRNLGSSYTRLANYQLALQHSFQALAILKTIDRPREQADVMYVIALTYRDMGYYFEALDYALAALQLYEELDDLVGQARMFNLIGLIYQSTDDPSKALAYFIRSLRFSQQSSDLRGQSDALNNISDAYRLLGEAASALTYGLKSLELHQQIGYRRDEGLALITVGEAYLALENYDEAFDCFQKALALAREVGHQFAEMLARLNLGDLCYQQGQIEPALAWLDDALTLAEASDAKQEQFRIHRLLSKIYQQTGNFEQALVHYQQFHTIKEKVFNTKVDYKLKNLEAIHRMETARKETEIYRLKNVELEREIADRKQAEAALQQVNEALRQRLAELDALNQIARTVATVTDLPVTLNVVAEMVTQLFKVHGTAIALLNPFGSEITILAHYEHQATSPGLVGYVLPVDDNPVTVQVIHQRRSLVIPKAQTNPLSGPAQAILQAKGIQCLMITPLAARAEVIGAIIVSTDQMDREFSPAEVTVAETIAGQIAGAIEINRLLEIERRQRQRVESQNQELDAFAHTVAHDLKNPLALIIGYTDFLIEYFNEIETTEMAVLIRGIKKTGYKAINIIEELLLLAGIRRQEVAPVPLNMADIVGQAQERLAYMINEYGGEIILPASWPAAMGYGPWIEEVWTNYLSNGLKYGGSPPRLELGACQPSDGRVCFWIRDNGPGLTPEQQAKLFTEFSHLNEIRAEGHGLGLSIVRRIVEKLGGKVGVESEGISGQGSTFYFILPAA
jgi:signal transduction histidine kinase